MSSCWKEISWASLPAMKRVFLSLLFLFAGTVLSLGQAADGKIRNVLFLISDDLKASALGCYGNEICQTPHLDALAAHGTVFERTYCQGTSCGPSRRSFMYSRYTGNKGVTLGKHLIDEGFYSARVGKIFHMRVPGDIIAGTDGQDVENTWVERFNAQGDEAHTEGLYRLLNQNISTRAPENRQSTKMPYRMFASVVSDGDGSEQPDFKAAVKTVELLRQRAASEDRFFLATGFVRPHYPSVAPKKYFDMYPLESIPAPYVPEGDLDDIPKLGIAKMTDESSGIGKYPDNIRQMWADYYATVTFMDEQVGRVLAELDASGLRDSTVVIFTSDHGYHLGEHHMWQKSNFHEEAARVPLIISAPGFEPGRSLSMTELVDIYPTICELLGIGIPEEVQGTSLVPILKDPEAEVKKASLTLDGSGRGVRAPDWAYMRYKDGTEELYDMNNDPGQFTNVVNREEVRGKKVEMSELLDKIEKQVKN